MRLHQATSPVDLLPDRNLWYWSECCVFQTNSRFRFQFFPLLNQRLWWVNCQCKHKLHFLRNLCMSKESLQNTLLKDSCWNNSHRYSPLVLVLRSLVIWSVFPTVISGKRSPRVLTCVLSHSPAIRDAPTKTYQTKLHRSFPVKSLQPWGRVEK